MTLGQLKWVAILVPSFAVATVEFLRHQLFHDSLPTLWGNLVAIAAVFAGAFLFSQLIFARIARLQQQQLEHSQELAALSRLALALGRSLRLEEQLDTALELSLELTQAHSGTICLLRNGKPAVVREKGLSHPCVPDLPLCQRAMETGTALIMRDAPSRAFVPLRGKETVGVLALSRYQPFPPRATEVLTILGRQVGSALENATLLARIEELAVLEERDRIAREVHDGLAQILGVLSLKAATVGSLVSSGQHPQAERELKEMERIAQEAYADTREVILGLRSRVKLDGGFVQNLAEYLQKFQRQSSVPTELVIEEEHPFRFSPRAEVQLIRIVQEALTNVRKHAKASRARVIFSHQDAQIKITVEDNGQGFAVDEALGRREGFGLHTMQERAESIGGSLRIVSQPQQGTRIEVLLPREG